MAALYLVVACLVSAGASNQTTTTTIKNTTAARSDYWVQTRGSGKNCTQARSESTPLPTIAQGITCISAGETLTIKAGKYIYQFGNDIPNGTSWGNATTIRGAAGQRVIITGSLQYDRGVRFSSASTKQYIIFDNLEFSGTAGTLYNAVKFDARTPPHNHIRLTNSEMHSATTSCILDTGLGSGASEYLNNSIHDCGTSPTKDHGAYIQTDDNIFHNNDVYSNATNGAQFYAWEGAPSNNNVQYNRFYDNGAGGTRGDGVTVDGNNNLVANNLSWDNDLGAGIDCLNGNANMFYNNTVYSNLRGYETSVGCSNTEFRNNIFYLNGSVKNDAGSGTVEQTNLTTDPSFTDPDNDDFTFGPASSAFEAGTDLSPTITDDFLKVTRPLDTYWEIGAYEIAARP